MKQVTVNEASINDTPLIFLFHQAMRQHDLAERTGHSAGMDVAFGTISEIENAAVDVLPIRELPDILFRICVARSRMGDVWDAHLNDGELEPILQEVEDLLDNAMACLCLMSGCDYKTWRLDYYTCGDITTRKQEAA